MKYKSILLFLFINICGFPQVFAQSKCDDILLGPIYQKIEVISNSMKRIKAGELDHRPEYKEYVEAELRQQLSDLVRSYPWVYALYAKKVIVGKQQNLDLRSKEIVRAKQIQVETEYQEHLIHIYTKYDYTKSGTVERFNVLSYIKTIPDGIRQDVIRTIREEWSQSEDSQRFDVANQLTSDAFQSIFYNKGSEVVVLQDLIKEGVLTLDSIDSSNSQSLLHSAIQSKKTELALFILNHSNFNLLNYQNHQKDNVLHFSIRYELDGITNMILKDPRFNGFNHIGYGQNSILHDAILKGNLTLIKQLQNQPQFTLWDYNDPIEFANRMGHKLVMLELVRRKASIKIKSFWGSN